MTPAGSVTLRGIGIHTGAAAVVTLHPAEPGTGVRFLLPSGGAVQASVANVSSTTRCTVLGVPGGEETVATVEHLLSAFHGLGIIDADIKIDGPEVPILDGSALPWVEALLSVGMRQEDDRKPDAHPVLPVPVVVTGRDGAFLAAYPSDALCVTVAVSFDDALVGTQVARFAPEAGNTYARDVAPARTFGFIEEVEALRAAGLARGGSLDNAVIVHPDRYSVPLRFPGELAYHKLLDVLGDLYLAFGGPLPFPVDVIAVKPSHRLNVELASRLRETAAFSR